MAKWLAKEKQCHEKLEQNALQIKTTRVRQRTSRKNYSLKMAMTKLMTNEIKQKT